MLFRSPQVLLSAGFNQMDNRYLAKEGLWNVAVGLHWSLFDGGVYSSQADALAAKADAVAAQRADAETQIALQQRADRLRVDEAAARIDHGDLTALLYLQGYRRSEFVAV